MSSGVISKSLKKVRCQQILRRGAHVVSVDDQIFLLSEVFPLHPDWPEKVGSGVDRVEVRIGGVYKSAAFWLVRTDGSEVDISYKVSLDGHRVYSTFIAAARNEVSGQTLQWKRENPAPAEGMHCDHVHPFDAILKDWLELVDLKAEEIGVVRQRVGHSDLFLSRDLAVSWQRYHRAHARYQWLEAAANVAKSNTQTERSPIDEFLDSYEAEEQRARTRAA